MLALHADLYGAVSSALAELGQCSVLAFIPSDDASSPPTISVSMNVAHIATPTSSFRLSLRRWSSAGGGGGPAGLPAGLLLLLQVMLVIGVLSPLHGSTMRYCRFSSTHRGVDH